MRVVDGNLLVAEVSYRSLATLLRPATFRQFALVADPSHLVVSGCSRRQYRRCHGQGHADRSSARRLEEGLDCTLSAEVTTVVVRNRRWGRPPSLACGPLA